MKKYLSILSFLMCLNFMFGQGNNLQFSRALFEDYTVNTTSGSDYFVISNAFSVPTDKVWKITSLSASRTSPNQYISNDIGISKSGLQKYSSINTSSVNGTGHSVVLWLPEGSYDLRIYSTINNGAHNAILSGIEFNIVQ
jgi:hypothetical protein